MGPPRLDLDGSSPQTAVDIQGHAARCGFMICCAVAAGCFTVQGRCRAGPMLLCGELVCQRTLHPLVEVVAACAASAMHCPVEYGS